MGAAAAAGKNGKRTLLVEAGPMLGGELLSGMSIDGALNACGGCAALVGQVLKCELAKRGVEVRAQAVAAQRLPRFDALVGHPSGQRVQVAAAWTSSWRLPFCSTITSPRLP